jgi:hypothetical protein
MPICILGMHRSGTSMVTNLLEKSGLYLGDQLMPPSPANPKGYFENSRITYLNEDILTSCGGSWDKIPVIEDWDPTISRFQERALDTLEPLRNRGWEWGWKDPRNTITLPFWHRLVEDLKLVFVVRSPMEVAQSLYQRYGKPIPEGIELCVHYIQLGLANTANRLRIFTFYEDYFTNPEQEVAKLIQFCQLKKTTSPAQVVDTRLRHHSSGSEEDEPGRLYRQLRETYGTSR